YSLRGRANRAREGARAKRLPTDFVEGDAENLPFGDASFDAVTSIYGAMFAPDHARTAAEMTRVAQPGAAIALGSWTPEGFLGAMFRTIGAHVPPPAGVESPMLWGTEDHLAEIYGDRVEWTTHERRIFTLRYPSGGAFVGC